MPELTDNERAVLAWALDLAQDEIDSKADEFAETDQAAVTSLRRLTVEGGA